MISRPRRPLLLPIFLAWALGCGDAAPGLDAKIHDLMGRATWGSLNLEEARRLFTTPAAEDRPFVLVNLIRHRERAAYRDGRPTDLTGAEADAIYGGLVLPILAEIGAMPVFVAEVDRNLIDADGAGWDQVAVVRYPNRAAFTAMIQRPDFRAAAVHKVAGVERSTVLVGEERPLPWPDEFRRLDLSAVPYPPTAADPPIAVVNVLDYRERAAYADARETDLSGREAMALYEQSRAAQAFPLGVRPGALFAVEGELYGDGQAWEEVRINVFPSRATLDALISREALDQAGYEHRVAGVERTYTMATAPIVNAFGYLPAGAAASARTAPSDDDDPGIRR
jgi:hypothetical protein